MKSVNIVADMQATGTVGAEPQAAFSDTEWAARVELAALYRAVAHYGMTDLIYNHITLRTPDEPESFLINSFGMLYQEVTASSLFKIDHDANILYNPQNGFEVNPAGFMIHSAVHRARSEVNCVLHTHTRAGVAVSAMRDGLLPISQQACTLGTIAYHDFEGPVLTNHERERMVADLGDAKIMILRNHGLLVAATSVSEAFFINYMLESACRIQVDAMSSGAPIIPSHEALKVTAEFSAKYPQGGRREWSAVLRLLAPQASSYAK